MCGITGFYKVTNTDESQLLKDMSDIIKHRGPDQFGMFKSNKCDLYLAHQRLSIIDLSVAGKQPMYSADGSFIIIFNGEIYNYNEIRLDLEKSFNDIFWKGHSDTEVLVECIARLGVERTLLKLNGMFSFAVFDVHNNKLFLARDRFGEKPLYIYSGVNSFAFSSELKPLELFKSDFSINHSAIDAQLKYSYIPAPFSIYNEVFKLLPGHSISIDLNNYRQFSYSSSIPYWQVRDVVEHGLNKRKYYTDLTDAIDETEAVLTKSVKDRMVSDVPLGAFLSGGIDSTCITALMQKNSLNKVKTFSIGFNDKNYNEAEHAKAVANILGTEHHELYLNPRDMLDFVPKLADIYDEPFSDSSQLPTLMVSKFAKKHVSVALTGDAGDEVFCGYNRYLHGPQLINSLSKIPQVFRKGLGNTVRSISPNIYNKLIYTFSILIKKLSKYKRVGDNIHKLARVIDFKDEADLYKKLIINWPDSALSHEVHDIATDIQEAFQYKQLSLSEKMMWQDAIGYLQNDILTKVDRASMAVSLETRTPFLDNEVYRHAWSMPLEFKLQKGVTKYPLRQIISKYVPDTIMNRPKAGFGVPIHSWLRNELKDWAETLLSDDALDKSGCFENKKIRTLWNNHQSGKFNEQYALWNILMFQQWNQNRK